MVIRSGPNLTNMGPKGMAEKDTASSRTLLLVEGGFPGEAACLYEGGGGVEGGVGGCLKLNLISNSPQSHLISPPSHMR